MQILITYGLYIITAIFEITGCYLFMKWSKNVHDIFYFAASVMSLLVFAWLLTFHPEASGRVYAAYGGIYIATSIAWLILVDGIRPNIWDIGGAIIAFIGVSVIIFQPK